ncbi:disease resistance protein RPM1-like [Silene latifolia]|uniref:disease resistance protein RPM1-like n=1 Tax=Silene latifolia TaxID=37657 RepID=UPI003D78595C
MAETIVAFAIDKLLQIANTEADLVGSLPGEIKSISRELQSIKAILKDAEKKAEDDDGIKVWVSQVREVAYQIEDALDDYLFLKHERVNQPVTPPRSCFNLFRVGQCFFQHRTKHDLVITIKMIREEIGEINRRRERYEFMTTERVHPEHTSSWQDICALYVDDSELVGIEEPKNEVRRLLGQNALVALVGMGGLGKSTLARKLYNQVRRRFHIYAWVTVSRSYSVVDVLRSIYKQFLESAQEDSNWVQLDDSLQNRMSITEKLRSYLHESEYRYLVVLDDVWEEGSLLSCIKAALPAINDGSRLLMTTRDEDVASSWTTKLMGNIYQLKPLPDQEAWGLFCKKMFGNGGCPEELGSLASDIVRKCDGLPLTIVAVAGLLSTKRRDCSEWKKLCDTLGPEFAKNRHLKSSTRILLLSYDELPYYLKPCFLYFGMFPEDYAIDCMRLVRLWIAEGFIESCRGITLEEVALEYLTALVQRNLVQVLGRDVTGRCRSFRVHDVLREIILSKLEESGFSQVMAKDKFLVNTHFRRLSIHYCFDKSLQACSTTCNIRSVLVFDNEDITSFLTSSQLKIFRFLRVLDLQDASIYAIPEEVGDLRNLQLLSLRNTKVGTLPTSVGHLWNLQTLDLKSSYVSEIPSEAKSLQKLRHLLGYRSEPGPYAFSTAATKIPVGVLVNLLELQKLAFIDGSQKSLIIELRNLKQLTRLGIAGLTSDNGDDLCHAIKEMEHLRSLTIISTRSDEVLKVQNINQPPRFLERLYLVGALEKLPNWITGLNNLAKLALRYSRLQNDPAERLQELPNLIELDLYEAYDGTKLDFGMHGFRKLKVLRLFSLCNLKSIQGALPTLQNFRYRLCQQLVQVPPHIEPYLDLAISNLLRDRC